MWKRIFGHQTPGLACDSVQFDQGILCSITESLDTVGYIDV